MTSALIRALTTFCFCAALATAAAAQAPDLSANFVSGPASVAAGGTMTITRDITNVGGFVSPATLNFDVRFSTNTSISGTDPLVQTLAIGSYGAFTVNVTVPVSMPLGTYFIGLLIPTAPNEFNTFNNSIASTQLITVTQALPDIQAVSIAGPATATRNQVISVTRNVANLGGPIPGGVFSYQIFLSTDQTITPSDTLIASFNSTTLGSFTVSATIPANMPAGSYSYGLVAGNVGPELNGNNNIVASTAQVSITLAVPTITSIAPTTGPAAGGTLVTLTGTNFVGTPLTVTFNGAAATAVTVVSPTQVTCVTPANPPAQTLQAAIVVTTPNGASTPNTTFSYGQPFPGSGEDFVMQTAINAGALSQEPIKQATTGNILSVQIRSPGAGFNNTAPLMMGQFYLNGFPPFGVGGFPTVHVDPIGAFVIFNGAQLGGGFVFPLPPGGILFQFSVPFGLNGSTLRLQALALSSTALNGFFAASHAHDIVFF
jgi:hypothetical protein